MTTLQPGAFVFACCSTFLSSIQWIRWPALASWPELLFRMPLAPAQPASRRRENFERIARAPILLQSTAAVKERHLVWDWRPTSWKPAVAFAFASEARALVHLLRRLRFGAPVLALAAFPQDDSRVQCAMALPSSRPEPRQSPERRRPRRSPNATKSAQGLGLVPRGGWRELVLPSPRAVRLRRTLRVLHRARDREGPSPDSVRLRFVRDFPAYRSPSLTARPSCQLFAQNLPRPENSRPYCRFVDPQSRADFPGRHLVDRRQDQRLA